MIRSGLAEPGGKIKSLGEADLLPGSSDRLIGGEMKTDKMELHLLPPASGRTGTAPGHGQQLAAILYCQFLHQECAALCILT